MGATRAAAECRRQAADCNQKAESAWRPSDRRFLLEMAQYWLVLARSYEVNEYLKHTSETLDGIGTRIEDQCGLIDAQCREIAIQRRRETSEQAPIGGQFTGLKLVASN
jgi:hypothetical protein